MLGLASLRVSSWPSYGVVSNMYIRARVVRLSVPLSHWTTVGTQWLFGREARGPELRKRRCLSSEKNTTEWIAEPSWGRTSDVSKWRRLSVLHTECWFVSLNTNHPPQAENRGTLQFWGFMLFTHTHGSLRLTHMLFLCTSSSAR